MNKTDIDLFGIYKITNLVNNKIYVGSTSRSFKIRCNDWHKSLSYGSASNQHLQNAWNKYGKDNFSFEILEIVENKSKVIEREQYYIDNLNPEYNILLVAGSRLGYKTSDETKAKISEVRKATRPSVPFCRCGKPVKTLCSPITGVFYKYLKTCGDTLCISPPKEGPPKSRSRNITEFSDGPKMSAEAKRKISEHSKNKKLWKYMVESNKGRKRPEHVTKILVDICSVDFEIRSPEGEIIKGKNISKFCRENNLTTSNFHKVLNGERKSCKGWTKV